ncbi:MAG: tetratricopeptide repeat protein [Anaerolineales bacterium]
MSNEYLERARALLKDGDYAEAYELLQSVLDDESYNPEALLGLGYLFYHLQRYEEGRQVLETSLHLEPDCAEAHLLLGSTCYMVRDWYAAMRHYREATVLEPTVPQYRLRLYAAYQRLGEPELALAELEAAYQLDPQILGPGGKAKLWRARVFAGLGPVAWLGGWVFVGLLLAMGGPYPLNQLLDGLGRYLPLASTQAGRILLRAGLMSLPFVITSVHQLRKRRYRRVVWVAFL